ncbi:MAG: hypothetical protein ABIC57_03360 [bacterium]
MKKIEWKKIIESMRKHWAEIVYVIFVIIISFINFRSSGNLLSNDNYSPELNPLMTIERSIVSPAWRSYRGLGVGSDSEQSDVFRSVFYYLYNQFADSSTTRVVYYLSMLFLGGFFMGLLSKNIFTIITKKKEAQHVFLFSSIVYITSLWTVWLFYQNITPFVNNWGVFPIVLFFTLRYIHSPSAKKIFALLFSFILFVSTALIATIFIVDTIFYLVFIFFFLKIVNKKLSWKVIKSGVQCFLLFLGMNLFWLLPFLFYSVDSRAELVDSYINKTITSSVIDLERETQNGTNSLSFYTRIISEENEEWLKFPMSGMYLDYEIYIVIALIPAIFSFILLLSLVIKRKWIMLVPIGVLFISWFLIKVDNPPFGSIFAWLQNKVPLFRQVLRWPSSKLNGILLIALSLCGAIGFGYFLELLVSFGKSKVTKLVINGFIVLFFLLGQFLFAEYMFSGNLFPSKAFTDFPEEYFELGDYLIQNDPNGRIYYAPPSNNNYFREYNWGFNGSQFISYVVQNPILDLSHAVGSGVNERALINLSNLFRAADSDSFLESLNMYDVEYLLLDESVEEEGFSFDIDLENSSEIWKKYPKVWSSDFLSLYKVPQSIVDSEFVESDQGVNFQYGTFTRNVPLYPKISSVNLDLENTRILGDRLVGEYRYDGESTTYSTQIKDLNWYDFYSGFIKTNDEITLLPEYPRIGDSILCVEKTYKLSDEYSHFVIDDIVVSSSELEDEVITEDKYYLPHELFGVSDTSFETLDITNDLILGKAQDCSGDSDKDLEIKYDNETGFSIEGKADLPCVYSNSLLQFDEDWIAELSINWEGNDQSYPGFCFYSTKLKRCLNDMRYMSTTENKGEIEYLIPSVISKYDEIRIILYSLSRGGSSNFTTVSVKYSKIFDEIEPSSTDNNLEDEEITLENGRTYEVSIPIARGTLSYKYSHEKYPFMIWQPTLGNSSEESLYISGGMVQEVTRGFIDQSMDLFYPPLGSDILVYFKGRNVENIPSNLCINYLGSDDCWYQNIFSDSDEVSILDIFVSDVEDEKKFGGIFGSSSFSKKSVNILNEFAVLGIPEYWNSIDYEPTVNIAPYEEIEMNRNGNSSFSTFYTLDISDSEEKDVLVSIPESRSNGWIMFGKFEEGWRKVNGDRSVAINGWRQGWDMTNLECNNLFVIFWPNLLSYFGYLVIVILFGYLATNILVKKHGKK